MKHLFNKENIIGFIAAIIYRIYSWTFRYTCYCPPEISEAHKSKDDFMKNGILFAFWHQDDLACIPYFSKRKIIIMVSLSKDGRILASALKVFGYQIISGSSSRRGIAAFIGALKQLIRGRSFAIAVDGPRGPAFQAKEGVVKLSDKSKRMIYPLRVFPEKYYMFSKTWNKPRLPKLFSKITIVFGKPGFYTQEELTNEINSIKPR